MFQLLTMINKGHKAAKRYMIFLVVLQITVIVLILKQRDTSQNIVVTLSQNLWTESKKLRAGASPPSPSSSLALPLAKRPMERKVEAKLELKVENRNLPLNKKYLNGSLAFPNNRVPPALQGWSPSNESYRYFQPMEGKDAWIYSAFYVESPTEPASILAIGLARNPIPWRIYCHFHLDDEGKKFKTQAGHMKRLQEHHRTTVVPVFLECNVPNMLRSKFVSFTFAEKTTMKNSLPIQYEKPRTHNFTVCYAALHSKFNLVSQLVWSIEMNRILGAEHFYIYNFSVSPQVDAILQHYSKVGLVTIMQWPVPTMESWYIGQMALINDCMYRNRHFSKFVAFVDTDELIVPKSHPNWREMIKAIENNPAFQENAIQPPSSKSDGKKAAKSVINPQSKNQTSITSIRKQNSSDIFPGGRRLLSLASGTVQTQQTKSQVKSNSNPQSKGNSSSESTAHIFNKKESRPITVENKAHNATNIKKIDSIVNRAVVAKQTSSNKTNINQTPFEKKVYEKDPTTTTNKKVASSPAKAESTSTRDKKQLESSDTISKPKANPQEVRPVTKSTSKSITRSLASNPQQKLVTTNKSQSQAKLNNTGMSRNVTKGSISYSTMSKATNNHTKSLDALKSNNSNILQTQKTEKVQVQKQLNSSSIASSSSSSPSKSSSSSSSASAKSSSSSSSSSNATTITQPTQVAPIGSFLFRNIFFSHKHSPQWPSIKSEFNFSKSDEEFVRKYRISPLLHYLHYDTPFPARQRSKMIVRPDLVRVIGIHFVFEHRLGARSAHVAMDVALLHHYRGYDHEHSNTITNSAFRFRANLIKRIRERLTNFPDIFT